MACKNEEFQTDPVNAITHQSSEIGAEAEYESINVSLPSNVSDEECTPEYSIRGESTDQSIGYSLISTIHHKAYTPECILREPEDQPIGYSNLSPLPNKDYIPEYDFGKLKNQPVDCSLLSPLPNRDYIPDYSARSEPKDQPIDYSLLCNFSDKEFTPENSLRELKNQQIYETHSSTLSDKECTPENSSKEDQSVDYDYSLLCNFSDKEFTPENSLRELKNQQIYETSSSKLSDKECTPENSSKEDQSVDYDYSLLCNFSDKEFTPENSLRELKNQQIYETHSSTLSDKECTPENSSKEPEDQSVDYDYSLLCNFSDKEFTPENSLRELKNQQIYETSSSKLSDKECTPENSSKEPEDQSVDYDYSLLCNFSDKEITPENSLRELKNQQIYETSSSTLSDKECTPEDNLSQQTIQESIKMFTNNDSVTATSESSISQHRAESVQSVSSVSPTANDNEIQSTLASIGLKQPDIDYILDKGEKYLEKPSILAKKLKISLDEANLIISALKDYKQKPVITLTPDDCKRIEECLKEHPGIDSPEDISLLCDIDESIITAYFESKPLTESQKEAIREKYNDGYKVVDIVNILKISGKKVQEYVESTFLTFTSEEGKRILAIIHKNFIQIQVSKLREMVISKDLKLQDQLCCILRKQDEIQCKSVEAYFNKFAESNSFFEVDMKLTKDDILHINQCSSESVEQLSIRLQKVETIIRDHLNQYHSNQVLKDHQASQQFSQINRIVANFGKDKLSFQTYRMIISDSLEDMDKNADKIGITPKEVFLQLLPFSFYYLKCSLPLTGLTKMIVNSSQITITTHDLFHLIFQLSDPVLKGFCIEHYSFSNPVPLYYPLLISPQQSKEPKYAICKELWYSLQPFNGLISFGLGRAGWNPIGKSHLLDFIFGTDFEKGNPSNSAFHFNSIDIQMTNNLFGEMKDKSSAESTKWAYIDCHGNSNLDIIGVLCQQLDIALIHVTSSDYLTNMAIFQRDMCEVTRSVKHVYLFVRDCKLAEVEKKCKRNKNFTVNIVFIPNLTKQDINTHSVEKSLKEIGYEILHLNSQNIRTIGSEFLEDVMQSLDRYSWTEIQSNKELIRKITTHISKVVQSSSKIDFSFLSYYPLFIEYMSCFHDASSQTEQKNIDELNIQCGELNELLKNTPMGNVVIYFNEILQRDDSTLILWKLSQQLVELSKETLRRITNMKPYTVSKQKNNKYTIEILWREALLSRKYGNLSKKNRDSYNERFATNFSNHVEKGEAFELIDGDNLRFFNKDIDELLIKFYEKQSKELSNINRGKKVHIKQAPIVVSIFGPQSSGKSTLLNYCFGCKFLTSAGRCTRGVYGSLSKLSRTVNLTDHFLILDTEGLDAIVRGKLQDTSRICFDRTMVLFCLAVSQVVIINVKGDIGFEMQSLLQICGYSLNRLKVRKVAAPKIFFVLNQQADPDPGKHIDSINILMEKLNKEPESMGIEGSKISDLIQVSRDNLFILPSAFNSEQMNTPGLKLFDTKVIKLSPTIAFADKCADLRLAIIQQLDSMPTGNRAPFSTMSEWMDMSGTIWDTIIKYQDIVKYRNVEELICSNLLRDLVTALMEKNIYSNQETFQNNTDKLLAEINEIDTLSHPNIILTKIMAKFDEYYNRHPDDCLTEFDNECRVNRRLEKMNHICDEQRRNLSRLIYIERKNHEDKIKYHIRAVLTEIKLSESMNKFQEAIIKNVDRYLELHVEDQKKAFEETWVESFGAEDRKEEIFERDETLEDLYSIFQMESRTMENKSTIYRLFRHYHFQMNRIISFLHFDLLAKFKADPKSKTGAEQFFYPWYRNNTPIRDMTPFPGRGKYEYLERDSLFEYAQGRRAVHLFLYQSYQVKVSKWIPKECHPLVYYCSGYYNHPDITWGHLHKNNQILLLVSFLKDPKNNALSAWDRFMDKIFISIHEFIAKDPTISQGTVKEIVNFLYSEYKIVNHEIGHIEAMLSNTAERAISKYVFAIAFKSRAWIQKQKRDWKTDQRQKQEK